VKTAHKVMAEMGVRFNDFGTFARANRFARQEGRLSELNPVERTAS
ncbi:MAG: fatty acid desaturase, partial [Pseudomonas sp.]